MMKPTRKKIAILTADDGVERVELTEPRRALEAADAEVVHVTPDGGDVRTFDQADPSEQVRADVSLKDCDPEQFDALVLPGVRASQHGSVANGAITPHGPVEVEDPGPPEPGRAVSASRARYRRQPRRE